MSRNESAAAQGRDAGLFPGTGNRPNDETAAASGLFTDTQPCECCGAIPCQKPSVAASHPSLEELRTMTVEELDAAEICRGCWESYAICGCKERKERPYA